MYFNVLPLFYNKFCFLLMYLIGFLLGGTRGSIWLFHLWFDQFHLRCEFWFFINVLDWAFPRWDTWFYLTVPLVLLPVPLEMWVNGVEHCSDVESMVGNTVVMWRRPWAPSPVTSHRPFLKLRPQNEVLRPELARVVGKQTICYYK